MSLSVEEALRRVPQWAGRELRTTFLAGGITNQNVRVEAGGESFVLRLAGAKTDLLGIDRRHDAVLATRN